MARCLKLIGCYKGSTFNELLVAMNLIAVAVLGYSLSSVGMIRQQTVSDNFTVAIHLAQDKMESLLSLGVFPEVDLCPDGGDRRIGAKGGAGGIFDRCWKISASALDVGLTQIDVRVFWSDYREQQVALSTLIFTGGR